MAQQFFGILTQVGENKDANAKALGLPLVLTELAVGDGNGNVPTPDRLRTSLVNQVRRQPINQISKDPNNANQIVIEQVIPENEGGWWIREMGLYDEDGDLIAICNCPPSYKPKLVEGSGRTQVVRMVLIFSSAATVQLKIDPSVVLATRKYADDAMLAHESAANPHSQYATYSEISNVYISLFNNAKSDIGQIVFEARTTTRPGFLKANGALVGRGDYPYLWAYAQGSGVLVSEEEWHAGRRGGFSTGDDKTTFRLPDLRGEFIRCWADDCEDIDAQRTIGSWQDNQNRQHTHGAGASEGGDHSHIGWTDGQGEHNHHGWTGGGGAHQHVAPYTDVGVAPWGVHDSARHHGSNATDHDNPWAYTSWAGDHQHEFWTEHTGQHTHNVGIDISGRHSHEITVHADGGSESRPRNIALLALIRAYLVI